MRDKNIKITVDNLLNGGSLVFATHIPSGISASSSANVSEFENAYIAMRDLKAMLAIKDE